MGCIVSSVLFYGKNEGKYIIRSIFYCRTIDEESEKFESVAKSEKKIILKTESGINFPAIFLSSERNNKTLIYCHSSTVCLDKTMLYIAESYYNNLPTVNVLMFEYPGYGLAEGKPSEQNFYDALDAVVEFCKEKNYPIKSLIFYGRSLGTAVATYGAMKYNPAGLILQSAYTKPVSTICPSFCCNCANILTVVDKLKEVKCKTLLIHGKKDSVVPFKHALKLYSILKDPYKPLWLDDYGHNNIPYGDVEGQRKRCCLIPCCCKYKKVNSMTDKYFNHLLSFILCLNIPSSYYNAESEINKDDGKDDNNNSKSIVINPDEIVIEEKKIEGKEDCKENDNNNICGESKEQFIEKQSIHEEKEEL